MLKESSSKERLLSLVESPISYSDLKASLGVADQAIQRHLSDLKGLQLIMKDADGHYILSEKGREHVEDLSSIKRREGYLQKLLEIHNAESKRVGVTRSGKTLLKHIDEELQLSAHVVSCFSLPKNFEALKLKYKIGNNNATHLAFSRIYSSIQGAHFLFHTYTNSLLTLELPNHSNSRGINSKDLVVSVESHLDRANSLLDEIRLGEDFTKVVEIIRGDIKDAQIILKKITKLNDLRNEWKSKLLTMEANGIYEKLNTAATNIIYLKELLGRKLSIDRELMKNRPWGGRDYKTWFRMNGYHTDRILSTTSLLFNECKTLESTLLSSYEELRPNISKELEQQVKESVQSNVKVPVDINRPEMFSHEIFEKADELQKSFSQLPNSEYLEPFLARIAALLNRLRKQLEEYENWNQRHVNIWAP